MSGAGMTAFFKKLMSLRKVLHGWNVDVFGRVDLKQKEAELKVL